MVYLIENPVLNICKIGCSKDPLARLAALQTATPHILLLRATVEGNYVEESLLHERFKADRLGGEWFTMTDEIMTYFNVQREFMVGPGFVAAMFALNGSEIKTLLWMGLYATFNTNEITIDRVGKGQLGAGIHLNSGSVDNAITRLLKNNIIHRLGRGVYHIDPDTTWRGDIKARSSNIKVFLNYTIQNPNQP